MAKNRQTNSTKSFKYDKDLFLVFSRWATWSVWSWFAPKMLYCSAHVCEKEVKQVLNVTNIRPNKRKKVFKGAMERNPGVEEKEKKARCLWWSIQANIKYQNTMYFLSERIIKNTKIFWREVISEEWEEGGISFRAKRATPKVVYHSVSTRKCPDFSG